LVKSSLRREAPAPLRWVTSLFAHSPEPVAQSVVYYASSQEVQAMTGLLFKKGRQPMDSSPYTKDRAVQQHLWEASMALAPLEEVTPGERIQSENKSLAAQRAIPSLRSLMSACSSCFSREQSRKMFFASRMNILCVTWR